MLMRTMSLYESGDSSERISLKKLFKGNVDIDCENNLNLEQKIVLQQAIDY